MRENYEGFRPVLVLVIEFVLSSTFVWKCAVEIATTKGTILSLFEYTTTRGKWKYNY